MLNSFLENQLHAFLFDEKYSNLTGFGTATPLKSWYEPGTVIQKIVCAGQLDEIAVLDSQNRVRVFSLITQMFRSVPSEFDRSTVKFTLRQA